MLIKLIRRELLRHWRNRQDLLNPIVFFLIVVTLFPLAVTPDGVLLAKISSGVVWISVLLSAMLSLQNMYSADYQDGTLELLLTQSGSVYYVVIAKVIAHWMTSCVPLIIISPVLGLMLQLDTAGIGVLMVSLLIGTPVLSLMGALGTGLTVGLRQSGVLLSLLILPLYIPILIFGASAVANASLGLDFTAQLAFMSAFLFASASLIPFAAVAAIKLSIQ